MNRPLENQTIEWWEPWVTLLFLLCLFPLSVGLSLLLEQIFPGLSSPLSLALSLIVWLVLPVIQCTMKYGPIKFEELLLTRKDFMILGIALILDFWAFGLTVGPEGFSMDEDLRKISSFQYWAVVSKSILFGPFLEELLFRRYLGEIFASLYSPTRAVFLVTIIGTLLHMHSDISWFSILWHIFASLLFTVVYFNSRLGVSFVLHSFHNTMVHLLIR